MLKERKTRHFTAQNLRNNELAASYFLPSHMDLPAVGYQNHTLLGNGGINWMVATLQDMKNTLEEQTLGSFLIPTDESFMSGDSIILEIYGTDGKLKGEYSFCDEVNCGNYGLTNPGWYPYGKMMYWEATDDDLSNDIIVPFGSGVIITSSEANTKVTFAGQVLGEKTYALLGNGGINWVGNATPVDLELGDLGIPTDESFMSGDSIILEIYGTDGKLKGEYSFCDEVNCGNYGLTNPGWYPYEKMMYWEATDDDLCNTVPLASGQLVIITSSEADTTLTLPDPIN